MIIETFGPPGAGKTTFTEALAQHLHERGYAVDLMLTLPRIENPVLRVGGVIPAIVRVVHAIASDVAILCRPYKNAKGFRLGWDLLRLMPPKDVIWWVRLSQYVMRFSCVWSQSHRKRLNRIVIYDQGFVQVAVTLALFSEANTDTIARAMELRSRSDLLIRFDAPIDMLERRLHQRVDGKPGLEKLFEADVETFLKAKPIVDYVESLLAETGDSMICVNSLDQTRLNAALDVIERAIAAEDESARSSSPNPATAPKATAA